MRGRQRGGRGQRRERRRFCFLSPWHSGEQNTPPGRLCLFPTGEGGSEEEEEEEEERREEGRDLTGVSF